MIRKSVFLFFLNLVFLNSVYSQLNIVPVPVQVQQQKGSCMWSRDEAATIIFGTNDSLQKVASFISRQLFQVSGIKSVVVSNSLIRKNVIVLKINGTYDNIAGKEGYRLSITKSGVTISANSLSGIFYASQTLMQLIPLANDKKCNSEKLIKLPLVSILDYPRFGWRGLMLDVSRHFYNKLFVEKYIDQMAKYKLNVFHWHLSDDPGWRIEIKSLPQLTKIGAWRVPRTGLWGQVPDPMPGEKATEGGYYTERDIKEIVKYALDRFVTIVPEIDIPGHSQAFIAAYPNICCTQQQYAVYPGSNTGTRDNVLCAGNDSCFTILDKIITQLAALFPGKYIHIGGDEVDKRFWKECLKCQKRIKEEGLKDEQELQSYFVKRVEKIVESKGKKVIGWDEILEGGLAPDATVMSWRGEEGGIAAAKMGHSVVMSPTQYCYLDYRQGEEKIEFGPAFLPVSQIYLFEPIPEGVTAKYILGGQANLWTESVASEARAEYMTWPRAMALSEVLWSPKAGRDWESFESRMESQFPRLTKAGVRYAPSVLDARVIPVKTGDGQMQIKFLTEISNLDIYYSFAYTFPDTSCSKYTGHPIAIPIGAADLWSQTFRKGKPVGRLLKISINEIKQRLN